MAKFLVPLFLQPARSVCVSLSAFFINTCFSLSPLFQACVHLSLGHSQSLQIFNHKCLCRIVNVHWPDNVSNSDLWRKTDQESVLIPIKRRKWSWLGHTLRRNDMTTALTEFVALAVKCLTTVVVAGENLLLLLNT